MLKKFADILVRRRFYLAILGGVAIVHPALSLASATTKRPWSDEGLSAHTESFERVRNYLGTGVL
jgi:hypothetical protein